VVFSTDLIITLILGVRGEWASLRGSKFRRVFKMRLEVPGLVRTRIDKQFKVASTIKASLHERTCQLTFQHTHGQVWALTCSHGRR
jgi:hypothetical protein